MKVNKVNTWIYWIFTLMPILACFIYMIIPVFSHTYDFTNFTFGNFIQVFDNIWETDTFGWVSSTPYFDSLYSFASIIFVDGVHEITPCIVYYCCYALTISLFYLGIEVLMWFINFARKFMYKVMEDK